METLTNYMVYNGHSNDNFTQIQCCDLCQQRNKKMKKITSDLPPARTQMPLGWDFHSCSWIRWYDWIVSRPRNEKILEPGSCFFWQCTWERTSGDPLPFPERILWPVWSVRGWHPVGQWAFARGCWTHRKTSHRGAWPPWSPVSSPPFDHGKILWSKRVHRHKRFSRRADNRPASCSFERTNPETSCWRW